MLIKFLVICYFVTSFWGITLMSRKEKKLKEILLSRYFIFGLIIYVSILVFNLSNLLG